MDHPEAINLYWLTQSGPAVTRSITHLAIFDLILCLWWGYSFTEQPALPYPLLACNILLTSSNVIKMMILLDLLDRPFSIQAARTGPFLCYAPRVVIGMAQGHILAMAIQILFLLYTESLKCYLKLFPAITALTLGAISFFLFCVQEEQRWLQHSLA